MIRWRGKDAQPLTRTFSLQFNANPHIVLRSPQVCGVQCTGEVVRAGDFKERDAEPHCLVRRAAAGEPSVGIHT